MYRNMKRLNHSCDMENVDSDHVNAHIRNYLVSLGIPSKLSGCSYLTEAVRLAKLDSTLMRNLSRGLYLEISRNLNSTPCRIERSMRSAISIAYHRGGRVKARTADGCGGVGEIVDRAQQGNAVQAGKYQVKQHHIRVQMLDLLKRALSVAFYGQNLNVGILLEEAAKVFGKQGVCVGNHNSNLTHIIHIISITSH